MRARRICEHRDVAAISFTGGTATGAKVAAAAAPLFKKLSLELGGKNPNVIFADADLDECIATSVRSSFWNQGEICLCGSRLFVERSIHDQFVERFVEATRKLRIGDPMDDTTDVGAVVSEAHMQKVLGYVDLAKRKAARSSPAAGASTARLVLRRAGRHHRARRVLPHDAGGDLRPGRDDHPVRSRGGGDPLRERDEVRPVGDALDARSPAGASRGGGDRRGTVWINCWLLRDLRVPFGGMKDSGVGREGGFESLNFFTEAKNVCVKLG